LAPSAGKGLSVAEVGLMSGLVFAGGAQFAAVEIWRAPPPIAVLAFSTLLINARHLLDGRLACPKNRLFSPVQRFLLFFFLLGHGRAAGCAAAVDGDFLSRDERRILDQLGHFASLGGAIGAIFGDPRRLGADFAFSALFHRTGRRLLEGPFKAVLRQ
jgi:predicted branched-subunit amino acid permease